MKCVWIHLPCRLQKWPQYHLCWWLSCFQIINNKLGWLDFHFIERCNYLNQFCVFLLELVLWHSHAAKHLTSKSGQQWFYLHNKQGLLLSIYQELLSGSPLHYFSQGKDLDSHSPSSLSIYLEGFFYASSGFLLNDQQTVSLSFLSRIFKGEWYLTDYPLTVPSIKG